MGTAYKSDNFFTANAREEALKTLVSWEKGKGNLDQVAREAIKLVRKDSRPFYLEMVKGTIRNLSLLDYRLEGILDGKISSLPSFVRNILRLGGYQLDFMHIPKPVTVNLMVELSKSYGHPGTTKLVNSVLRKMASGFQIALPENQEEALGITYSHPVWLVKKWMKRFGETETKKLLEWNNSIPPLDVHVNRLRITPAEFFEICSEHNIPISCSAIPEAFTLHSASFGPVEKIPGYKEGFFWVQSISALFPALLLNPVPNEKVLDLCAAPGGKSCQMAEMMEDQGEILALDVSRERIKKIEENKRRLGMKSIQPVLADGREAGDVFPESQDAILLDAPCSATGSFRRKVDARWKKSLEDLQRHANLQYELLESAARALRPGGRMVYATCSLEKEENQDVIRQFLDTHPGFDLKDPHPPLPKSVLESQANTKPFVEILPQRDQLDGFFMVELRKNEHQRT